MSVSHHGDEVPNVSEEMISKAEELGWPIVRIICDDKAADGSSSSVSFAAITQFLPRAGDVIQLEDGKACIVKNAFFNVGRTPDEHIVLGHTIYATLVFDSDPTSLS